MPPKERTVTKPHRTIMDSVPERFLIHDHQGRPLKLVKPTGVRHQRGEDHVVLGDDDYAIAIARIRNRNYAGCRATPFAGDDAAMLAEIRQADEERSRERAEEAARRAEKARRQREAIEAKRQRIRETKPLECAVAEALKASGSFCEGYGEPWGEGTIPEDLVDDVDDLLEQLRAKGLEIVWRKPRRSASRRTAKAQARP